MRQPTCPTCGSHEFRLHVPVEVDFYEDGDFDILNGNVPLDGTVPDDATSATCMMCGLVATLGDFSK